VHPFSSSEMQAPPQSDALLNSAFFGRFFFLPTSPERNRHGHPKRSNPLPLTTSQAWKKRIVPFSRRSEVCAFPAKHTRYSTSFNVPPWTSVSTTASQHCFFTPTFRKTLLTSFALSPSQAVRKSPLESVLITPCFRCPGAEGPPTSSFPCRTCYTPFFLEDSGLDDSLFRLPISLIYSSPPETPCAFLAQLVRPKLYFHPFFRSAFIRGSSFR